ncbi:MAG TPA: AbrB/MazE/SpoVT family DNA-binding domain-containing protein [Candidatus Nanoarchaeia archaeon]|nr:AbrB/MazE/SpoVT family DNA-binding domain-containing protein [Candidatus Nanoarchaeia archaeon]
MQASIEMGTVSSRGQIAIPSSMRKKMKLREGEKVLFVISDDALIIKKVLPETFAEITKPLKEAAIKAGLKEEDVPAMIQRFRAKKRE